MFRPFRRLQLGMKTLLVLIAVCATWLWAAQSVWDTSPARKAKRALHSFWAATRQQAARDLGQLGLEAQDALPDLLAAVRDPDAGVRGAAVAALGLLGTGDPAVVPAIVAKLKDPAPFVRRAAAEALGILGQQPKVSVPALVAALGDRDPGVRQAAITAFGMLESSAQQATRPLLHALNDENRGVRGAAALSLLAVGANLKDCCTPILTSLRGTDLPIRIAVLRSLRLRYGELMNPPNLASPQVLEPIVERLRSLQEDRYREVNVLVVELLNTTVENLGYRLAELDNHASQPAVAYFDSLIGALQEEDRRVRDTAAAVESERILYSMARLPACAALQAAIAGSQQSDDPRIRVVAGSALDLLTSPPTAEGKARDAYRQVSRQALEALSRALGNPHPSVRILAAKGLYGQTGPVSRELIVRLRAAARDKNPVLCLQAGTTLAWLAMNRRLPAAEFKEDLDVILPVAIQALEGNDPELKRLACPFLAENRTDERTLKPLAKELSSPDAQLRLMACTALQTLTMHAKYEDLAAFRAVIPDLRKALAGRDLGVAHMVVECLRRIGYRLDEAQDVLEEFRANSDPDLRYQTAQALTWIADRRAERRTRTAEWQRSSSRRPTNQ